MNLTSRMLARSSQCPRYEDIIFLPRSLNYKETARIGKAIAGEEWLKEALSPQQLSFDGDSEGNVFTVERLYSAYEHYRMQNNGDEPQWLNGRSRTLQGSFRNRYVCGEGLDQFAIVKGFPYTGVGYVVDEGGLTENVANVFGLHRLHNIRQLGYLHDPVVREMGKPAYGTTFDHTRYLHSLDVSAITTLIMLRNGCEKNFTASMRAAALTHDVLTPAGGDTTKLVDREAFNEETDYPKLLQGKEWESLSRAYGLSAGTMSDAVQGRGLPGTFLDIADKISYVSRDASAYYYRIRNEEITPGCRELNGFIEKNPLACSLWDSVRIEGNRAIITDAGKLRTLLALRGLLFRQLYQNPMARYFEHLLSSVIVRYLYVTGRLTKKMLLKMCDSELDGCITQVLGPKYCWGVIVGGIEDPHVEAFATRAEAEVREQELLREGMNITLIEHVGQIMKPCIYFLVTKKGRVMPFSEAYPRDAETISAFFRIGKPVRLYYSQWPLELGEHFKEALRLSHAEITTT